MQKDNGKDEKLASAMKRTKLVELARAHTHTLSIVNLMYLTISGDDPHYNDEPEASHVCLSMQT